MMSMRGSTLSASDSDAEDIIETRVGEDESAEESSLEDF